MGNPAFQPVTEYTVKKYLLEAFLVDEATVDAVLVTPEAQVHIERGKQFGSMTYYPGNQIAADNGWEDNPDYDDTNYDDEEEDEDY